MADGIALRINKDSAGPDPAYTAQAERFFNAANMMPGAGPLAARDGVRLGTGSVCAVSASGLQVDVSPVVGMVKHAVPSGGDYLAVVPELRSKTLGAKPGAGLKRHDAVVLDIEDEDETAHKTTSNRDLDIVLVTGTPTSGTPTAPAAGPMQLVIGVVAFDGPNTPTIYPTNQRYFWASGGIGVVHSQAERDAIANPYDGLMVYRKDLATSSNPFDYRANGAWVSPGSVVGSSDDAGPVAVVPTGSWIQNSDAAPEGPAPLTIQKKNSIVVLDGSWERTSDLSAGGWVQYATITAEYRPTRIVTANLSVPNGQNTSVRSRVHPSGVIELNLDGSELDDDEKVWFDMTWVKA